jgi:hypothetical protein
LRQVSSNAAVFAESLSPEGDAMTRQTARDVSPWLAVRDEVAGPSAGPVDTPGSPRLPSS